MEPQEQVLTKGSRAACGHLVARGQTVYGRPDWHHCWDCTYERLFGPRKTVRPDPEPVFDAWERWTEGDPLVWGEAPRRRFPRLAGWLGF